MRHIISLLVIVMMVCGSTTAQKKGFELHGNIEGLKDRSDIYLIFIRDGMPDTITTTKSTGSKFILKGSVTGAANYYYLKLDTNINRNYSNPLWLVNSKLSVKGSLNDYPKLSLSGSEPNNEYYELENLSRNIKSKPLTAQAADFKAFINSHQNSLYVSDLIIKSQSLYRLEEVKKFYDNLTSRAKNSYWGMELKKVLEQRKLAEAISVSGKIPDFKINTPEGKKVPIYELIANSKYTLIDFWASWCAPCRAAIPELRKVYSEFHDKGFNIIGVSSDKKETDWRKALAEDKTPWLHGLDNVEYAGKNIFGLKALPSYILIDSKGMIIQSALISSNEACNMQKFEGKDLSADLMEILTSLMIKSDKSK